MSWQQRFEQALEQRRNHDGWRVRQANAQAGGRWLWRNGRRYLNFSANDYLGLSQHQAVIDAWCAGARRYGVGSGGSAYVSGYHQAHEQLEMALAQWLGYPRALLFISGFAANQAVIQALGQKNDIIIADKLSHSSLLEAALHSPAQLRRFGHNSLTSLEHLLTKPCAANRLIVTEGIFSMDGDSAPLAAIQTLAQAQQALLLVDDAHGIGTRGDQGRGSCASAGISADLLIVTFGKAFGISGAAVLCNELLADYLTQFSRHLIYSTAMPPAQSMALSAALQLIQQGQPLRERLWRNIAQFRAGAAQLPFHCLASHSAIQPLIIGDNGQALRLAETLRQQGIWLCAIRPPTVPQGTARLRITLSAAHETQDIERLLQALRQAAKTSE